MYIVDFKEKRLKYLTSPRWQCSLIAHKSVLSSQLTLPTGKLLASCYFSKSSDLRTIRKLASNNSHSQDMVKVFVLKLWDDLICKDLDLTFKTCEGNGRFPLE